MCVMIWTTKPPFSVDRYCDSFSEVHLDISCLYKIPTIYIEYKYLLVNSRQDTFEQGAHREYNLNLKLVVNGTTLLLFKSYNVPLDTIRWYIDTSLTNICHHAFCFA